MKRNRLSLIILLLFIIGLLGLLFVVNVAGTGTLNYSFDTREVYNEINPSYDKSLNIRNQTSFTQTYNGTYSFTYESNGATGTSIDFIDTDTSDASCGTIIVSTSEDHDKILRVFDDNNAGRNLWEHNFDSNIEEGTIEFWIMLSNVATEYHWRFRDGSTFAWRIRFISGNLEYESDGGWQTLDSISANTWNHIRIDFELTAGGYLGLSQYEAELYLNGYSSGVWTIASPQSHIDNIQAYTFIAGDGLEYDHDAFGFSWDTDYEINDNIVPYNYVNETTEVDKWEFFNNEDGSATTNGQQNIPYWDELLTIGYITKNVEQFEDETAVYFPVGDTDHEGIERSIDVTDGQIREFYFHISYGTRLGSVKVYNYYDIDSYDNTLICRIRIDDNAVQTNLKLSYYNGSSYHELEDLVDTFGNYELNITIIDNIVICRVNSSIYHFPTIVDNKEGVGDVKIEVYGASFYPANWGLFINSIGIYIDGTSQSNDFGNYYYETGKDFNSNYDIFFNMNATGFFGCSMTSFAMSPQTYVYFSYQNASEISFINSHSGSPKDVEYAYLTISANSSFIIHSVYIRGVILKEGTNEYSLNFEHSNVDITYNYFYETGNKLYWNLTINDNDLEYLEATFDINNLQSENRSISFKSNINGNGRGFLALVYSDTSDSTFEFPYYSTTTTVILPQTQEIDKFTILITDNDDSNNGFSVGYISGISLIYYPDLATTITSLNLLGIIVPLIVLIAPPMALQKKFGSKIILPMFILMALICVVSKLIPVWLFFIIAFASIGFIVLKDRVGGEF